MAESPTSRTDAAPRGAALVTGGSLGIGLATARGLAATGRRVAILARDPERGLAAAASLGSGHVFIPCDVGVESELRAAATEVERHLGPVEILVNNAGAAVLADVERLTSEEWDLVFNLDLKAAWVLSQALLSGMRAIGGGAIVNVSSIHANLTRAGVLPYPAAKAGMLGLTRAMALELARDNIRVNAVCPGYVRAAPLLRQYEGRAAEDWARLNSIHPLGRIGEADEIASVIVFLASQKASFVTGATWNVDGGLTARFAD